MADREYFTSVYNDSKSFEDPFDNLSARNRQFASDLRRGAFEVSLAQEAQVRQHPIRTARRKLAAVYPKGLQADEK